MMIILFLEIIFGSSDAYIKLDALMLMSCNVLCVLKLLSFRLYADNLIRNYSSAVNDYSTIDSEEKRTIMRQHAFMGRMICYSTIFFTYLASSIFTLAPMITDDENVHVNISIKNQAAKLPVPITFLGNLQIPTGLYFIISTVQYFILLLTGTSNCGNKLINIKEICIQIQIYFI